MSSLHTSAICGLISDAGNESHNIFGGRVENRDVVHGYLEDGGNGVGARAQFRGQRNGVAALQRVYPAEILIDTTIVSANATFASQMEVETKCPVPFRRAAASVPS